jgi:hypothetical protein
MSYQFLFIAFFTMSSLLNLYAQPTKRGESAVSTTKGGQSRTEKLKDIQYGNLFTPGVSGFMLPKGFAEVNYVNTLLTARNRFDNEGFFEPIRQGINRFRQTAHYSQIFAYYGISRSGKFNIGADATYTQFRTDIEPNSSPLKIFGNNTTNASSNQRAFTNLGVRIRYAPLYKSTKLICQSNISFPVASEVNQNATGQNRISWGNQALYLIDITKKWFAFGQIDLIYRIRKDQFNTGQVQVPVTAYTAYQFSKFLPFALISHGRFYGKDGTGKFSGLFHASQWGLGLQFQPSLRFSMNTFYSQTFNGKSTNAWDTINLSIRCVI